MQTMHTKDVIMYTFTPVTENEVAGNDFSRIVSHILQVNLINF